MKGCNSGKARWRTAYSITKPNLDLLAHYAAWPMYWHQVIVKESQHSLQGPGPSSCSKDPNSSVASREGVLKATFGVRAAGVWCFSDWWWWGWCCKNLNHPPPGSNKSGVNMLWSACGHHQYVEQGKRGCGYGEMGSLFLQNNSKICVRLFYICIPWGGTNTVSLLLLNYCFLIVFPLFLHPFTSLISNCLSLLFGTQERPRRPCPF